MNELKSRKINNLGNAIENSFERGEISYGMLVALKKEIALILDYTDNDGFDDMLRTTIHYFNQFRQKDAA